VFLHVVSVTGNSAPAGRNATTQTQEISTSGDRSRYRPLVQTCVKNESGLERRRRIIVQTYRADLRCRRACQSAIALSRVLRSRTVQPVCAR
jgi:hypothetical protein